MAIEERSWKTNGYKVRSWGDLAAISTVAGVLTTMLVACILWGLKLEEELNTERNRNNHQEIEIRKLERIIDSGILSVSQAEINNIKERDKELSSRIDRLEDKH